MPKPASLSAILLVVCCSVSALAQESESTTAPQINTFSLTPDARGALGNSVNLFTGDVALPLNLVTLPGRNGLDVGVNISYSSNIQNQVDTWNVEAPSGVLGLGWSFDFEKIIVDHKNTGSRFDDDFYLIAGGSSNLMIRTGTAPDGAYEYETKNYQRWKILCYTGDERWEITRENGMKYVYGGGIGSDGSGQRTSQGNSVQWGVKWGNWIGSSNVTTGQSQFAFAWNLSKIQNTWGESVTFAYDIVEQYVGSTSGKKHTTASYLKTITDVLGRTVDFYYDDKSHSPTGPREYQAAHNEHGNTGVYQDKFETRFLDYIAVFDIGGTDTLSTTRFAYHPLQYLDGNYDLAKRYLKSITQYVAGHKAAPALVFDYYFTSTDPRYGALKSITYPEGGIATYDYASQTIIKSDRSHLTITAPSEGYYKPRAWLAEDYVVVTWFHDSGIVEVYAYQWDGRWIPSGIIGSFSGVYMVDGKQNFEISVERDFFVLLEKYWDNSGSKVFHLFHKNQNKPGEWFWHNHSNYLGSEPQQAAVSVGRNFAAVFSKDSGHLYRYLWNQNNSTWEVIGWEDLNPSIRIENTCDLGGTNNYFAASYPNQSLVNVPRWYYLDELDNWQQVDGVGFALDGDNRQAWFAGPVFAIVLFESWDGHHQWIYRWDETFSSGSLASVSNYTGIDVKSKVGIFESTVSISGNGVVKGMRWTGANWIEQIFTSNAYTSSAAGADFIVRRDKNAGTITRYVFDPTSNAWTQQEVVTGLTQPDPVDVSGQAYGWYTSSGSNPQAKLYNRIPTSSNGWSSATAISSWGECDRGLRLGSNFYAYENCYPNGSGGCNFSDTKIGLLKNGDWNTTPTALDGFHLPGSEQQFINTLVTHNSSSLNGSSQINLYRVLKDGHTGPLTDLAVSSISINDGYDVMTMNFAYDASRAVYDPSGMVAQYNEVKVTAGTNGYTKHYFFNGLAADDLLVDYPPNDAFTNAEDFLSLMKGLEYKTQVYNSSDVLVSSTTKYWKAVREQLRATDEGVYIRLMKETSTLDGVEKIVENTYNSLGLAIETKTYNHNWDGNLDTHSQSFKYWYEAYDTDLSENLLTPVIQTTTKTNTTVTSVSATAWKEWYTGKWAPHKTYQWNGSGGSNFDFSSWSGSGEPSSGWLKTSEITAVNAEGAVLQSKNLDGVHQATLYDYPKLRPIAGFTHARILQTALGSEAGFLSFETGNTTSSVVENDYWSFPPNPISISTNAHTGRYSCSLDADNNSSVPVYGPTRDFRPPDLTGQQRKYILSCWVRTQPGFGANNGQLVIHSKQDSDSDNTVYPNATGALITLSFGNTQGQWQYLEAILDLGQVRAAGAIPDNVLLRLRCYPVNYDDTHFLLVDDLRLSPVDAPFSATVYDPQYDFAIAALGTNGETMRTIYDSRQRPLATVGPNENVSSLTLPYYSREGNNDAFNASDPNSSLSLSARNGGIYDGFDDGNHTGWDVSNGNWTVTSDKKLKNTGVDGSDYAVLQNFSASNFGVAAKVEKISGNDFGLQIGNVLVRWVNKWQIKDGAEVLAEDIATPLSDNWLLLASNKTVFFFAGGKLVFTEIRPAAVSGQLKLFTGAAGTQVTFDDILVLRDPVIARNFLDGAGKARQSRTFNGLMSQISETVYDAIGRPAVQTKTAEFFNSPLSFRPDFVDNMNWVLGDMTGGVANYYSSSGNGYSDDEGFPYSRQVYENSPLGRVIESGLPGLTFAVGRSHTALASYTKNNNENFYSAFPAGSFPLGQYFETIDISPDGVWTITWTDKAGNVMVTSTGPNESGINPTTSYQYDDFGNVVQINPPNYHNPPAGSVANDWPIVMSYDFFGRLKQKTTPDAQATYFYIYDKAGRMRFMMDANGAFQNPDHIQYWKYDALGRAIECGYLVQDWNATTLQSYADTDPAWPSTPATWRKKYTYDFTPDVFTSYLKGRLYKVETNNDGDTAAEVEETFAYDIYGNVLNKTARVLDYSASSYDIAYEYDHAGNVTRITYIPENLLLQNETVTGTVSHSAANSITAGPGYTIASGASAVLQAGQKVILKPGFTAAQGGYFNARIDPFLTTDATVVTYTYDALGRLISVGTPSDADFYAAYTYHADGRLDDEKLANGAEIRDHFYNSPGWLLRIDGDRFKEDLTYNAGGWGGPDYYDGRIKTTGFMYNWAGKPADYAVQYTYDNLGQLTSADNNLNNVWDIGIGNTISYDPNGNILDLRRGSVTKNYVYYAGTNKVQNTDGSGNDYGYDANANVTSSSPKSINTIAYDAFTQRPTSVSMSSGASITLQYGSATQRVLKNYNDGSVTNSKLYLHGQNDYPLLEKDKTSAATENLTLYIYGLNGAIAKRTDGTVLFLLKDHLGSTRVVMDATGLVRTYYDYDALGNLIRTGTTNEVRYQFTGQEYDESGLHNYRARLYDSDLGKFYAMDPDGEFASPFIYAGNNALRYTDPSGRFSFVPLLFYAAYAAGNAAIDKEHMGLAALKSVGLSLASQGVSTVAHPIIGNYILAQGFSGGLTSGVQASMRNGSFGKGFTQGFIQSFALAVIQGKPQYSEESSFQERLNNFFHFRGWREDSFYEDFKEKDYSNFLTRLSLELGYDISSLENSKVYYDPSVDGGQTYPLDSGKYLMRVGNATNFWLETIPNAASILNHEWGHIQVFGMLQSPPFGPNNPYYLHETLASWIEMTKPVFALTTANYRENSYYYFLKWAYPLLNGVSSLDESGIYSEYIYGPK